MEEGKTGNAVKKCHDRGTRIKAFLIRAPRLQGTAGHLKYLGCLTLGDPLGVQIVISRKQVRTFEASPAVVAILVASLRSWIIVPTATSPSEPLPWYHDG